MALQAAWHGVLPADGGFACAENACFFKGNGFHRVAQIMLVVQIHAGDHGAVGIENIHCIQAAAQTDFQNHHVHLFAQENVHRGQCVEFKIGERRAAARGFDAFEGGHDGFVRHRLCIDGDAFVKAQQVRAGERADFVACLRVDLR